MVHGDPVERSPLGTDVSCGWPCKANRFISELSFEFFCCPPFCVFILMRVFFVLMFAFWALVLLLNVCCLWYFLVRVSFWPA